MQQPPPDPRQQPGYYSAVRPTNTLSVVSLVMGAAGFVILPFVGAIGAIITGHLAEAQIRQTGEDGAGIATAGLIFGYIGLVVWIGIVLVVIVLNQTASSPGQGPMGQ